MDAEAEEEVRMAEETFSFGAVMHILLLCCRSGCIKGGWPCDKTIALSDLPTAKWRNLSKSIHRGQEIYYTSLQNVDASPRTARLAEHLRILRNTEECEELHHIYESVKLLFLNFHIMWVSFFFPSHWQLTHILIFNQCYFLAHLTALCGFICMSKSLPLCREN